jgi:hypothetical protein
MAHLYRALAGRRVARPAFVLLLLLLMVGWIPPAAAQETRTAVIAAAQAEKATRLAPRTPSRAEELFVTWSQRYLAGGSGFYPYFDSVYSGGGFTLGAGYRHFVGDRTTWFAQGLYSLSQYKLLETGFASPGHLNGRAGYLLKAGWRDATQVGFYGLGMGTDPDDRANFRFKETFAGAEGVWRAANLAVLRGSFYYDDYDTTEGKGSYPSIEEVYTPAEVPGLFADPTYLHTTASAGLDFRPNQPVSFRPGAGYARRGGLYEVEYHNWNDRDGDYSFDLLELDAVQHIPVLRETWVLSLHGRVQTVIDDDDVVPYFLLPSLGSGSTLRAYPSWRFRDRHSLLMQGEWRWIANRLALDLAIFYDAGKVVADRGDLDFDGLEHNWGFGVRFHGPAATPLRVEMAKGSEGWNLVFAGSAAF